MLLSDLWLLCSQNLSLVAAAVRNQPQCVVFHVVHRVVPAKERLAEQNEVHIHCLDSKCASIDSVAAWYGDDVVVWMNFNPVLVNPQINTCERFLLKAADKGDIVALEKPSALQQPAHDVDCKLAREPHIRCASVKHRRHLLIKRILGMHSINNFP